MRANNLTNPGRSLSHFISVVGLGVCVFVPFTSSFGFENAKVLPKGVRNLNIRTVNTDLEHKTNAQGQKVELAQPLRNELSFNQVAAGLSLLQGNQMKAMLTQAGIDHNESMGEFKAEMKGHISVVAPIFSYGATKNTTIGLAAPIYQGSMSTNMAFQPSAAAEKFIASLAQSGRVQAARDTAGKFNNALAGFNDKLRANGYAAVEDWNETAMGDVTLLGKTSLAQTSTYRIAVSNAVVAPTGRTDDPNILNDIPFGDGQWDVYSQFAIDEIMPAKFELHQHLRYTAQLAGSKSIRMKSADDPLTADNSMTRFDLGDKVDAGTSMTWSPDFGLISGLGYNYFRKFSDKYPDLDPEVAAQYENDTDQQANIGESMLGFSTVPHYRSGSFAVPFELKLTYQRQFSSVNMPVTDKAQFDFNLYF